MAWQKTDNLLRIRLNQHGLGKQVEAGLICREAERLYPGMFEAVSVAGGSIHLKLQVAKQVDFLLIRGKLINELHTFCILKNLALVSAVRLTIIRM